MQYALVRTTIRVLEPRKSPPSRYDPFYFRLCGSQYKALTLPLPPRGYRGRSHSLLYLLTTIDQPLLLL